jgi:hypothetical protein
VHLLRVAFTKICAEHAIISPEAVLALEVRSVNSMKTSTGLSRLEIDCGRPARHPPLSEELLRSCRRLWPRSTHRWWRKLRVIAKLLFRSTTTRSTCGRRTSKFGDYVLVVEHHKSGTSKLKVKWKGPRRVASVGSDYVFVLGNLLTRELKAAHATRNQCHCGAGPGL